MAIPFAVTPTSVTRKQINAGSKTVYPIKSKDDIARMHAYLLRKAYDAPTPHKAGLAYRNWLYWALGINLGLRGGDICELTWDKVVDCATYSPDTRECRILDDEHLYINAEKTGKVTRLVYNPEAREAIAYYLKQTGVVPTPGQPVFASSKESGTSEARVSGHIDCDNLGRIIKQAARAVGIGYNVCSHTLRKTFGYFFYQSTGDLAALQYIFGHSSSQITLRYIGITDETVTEAYGKKAYTGFGTPAQQLNVLPFRRDMVDKRREQTTGTLHLLPAAAEG